MATPFGRFRWTRMPFRISPAPEIFQQKLDEALAGLAGVRPVADDILVYGEGKTLETAAENHDERFRPLLERSRETGLRLHRRKLKHRLSEVPYVGHLLSDQGLKVHPPKVAAVVKMPDPDNVFAVKRFIGMATYLSRYQTSQAVLSHCDSFSQRTAHGLGPWTCGSGGASKEGSNIIRCSSNVHCQHPPLSPVSIGKPAPKIHQWTIYFCRWGFGWVDKVQCFRSARRFGGVGSSPDFSRIFHDIWLLGI